MRRISFSDFWSPVPVTVQVANYANVGVKGSYQIVVDVERLP